MPLASLHAATQALQPMHRVRVVEQPQRLGRHRLVVARLAGVGASAAAAPPPASAPLRKSRRLHLTPPLSCCSCLVFFAFPVPRPCRAEVLRQHGGAAGAAPAIAASAAAAAKVTPCPAPRRCAGSRRRHHVLHLGHGMDRLGEADALLGAADAGMAATDRPDASPTSPKPMRRAVGVGFRPLAAELVEAVALAVALVAELHGEAAGIEVRAAFAVLVNQARVGEHRPAELIHRRQLAEGEEVHHGGQEVVRIGRATGNGDHRLAEHLARRWRHRSGSDRWTACRPTRRSSRWRSPPPHRPRIP